MRRRADAINTRIAQHLSGAYYLVCGNILRSHILPFTLPRFAAAIARPPPPQPPCLACARLALQRPTAANAQIRSAPTHCATQRIMPMASAHGPRPVDTGANHGTNSSAKVAGNITSQRSSGPSRKQKQKLLQKQRRQQQCQMQLHRQHQQTAQAKEKVKEKVKEQKKKQVKERSPRRWISWP